MKAIADLFLNAAVADLPFPSPKDMNRALLEQTMKSLAVTMIALNFAHHKQLGSNDLTFERSQKGSPFSITLDPLAMPPEGLYDRHFKFLADHDGFKILTFGKEGREPVLELFIEKNGAYALSTKDASGADYDMHRAPNHAHMVSFVGQWLKRHVGEDACKRAEPWVSKVINHMVLPMPGGPNAWSSPFGKLTA